MGRKLWILLFFCLSAGCISAQTNGTLSVSVVTSSTGGNYAPKNVVAIWIEDNSGKFVKTLLAYANSRKTHLNTWEATTTAAGSAFNITDAISGATQSSHATQTCQWIGTDWTGKLMPDNDYKIKMELTDKNATGNIASYNFTKGPIAQKQTPANVPSFSSVSLSWTTSTTGNNQEITSSNTIVVYPNPGTGKFTVIGEDIKCIDIKNLSGKLIIKSTTPLIDLTNQPNGIYLISILTSQETIVQKIIKK